MTQERFEELCKLVTETRHKYETAKEMLIREMGISTYGPVKIDWKLIRRVGRFGIPEYGPNAWGIQAFLENSKED